MTFQFRDDISPRTPVPSLLAYITDLEHAVLLARQDVDLNASASVCAAFHATPKEGQLLVFLSDGRVHSKESIHSALYFDPDDGAETKIIDVFVCKLRKKLAGSGVGIVTHWGIGYQMEGVDVFKRVMAGEPIEWDESVRVRPAVGRRAGAEAAPHGAVRDMALLYLHTLADDNGVVETTSRALCVATKGRRQGTEMIRGLEQTKRIKVLKKPAGKGGVWKLRLVEK